MERKQSSVKRTRPGQTYSDQYTFGNPVKHNMSRLKHKRLLNVGQFTKLEDRWLEYQD